MLVDDWRIETPILKERASWGHPGRQREDQCLNTVCAKSDKCIQWLKPKQFTFRKNLSKQCAKGLICNSISIQLGHYGSPIHSLNWKDLGTICRQPIISIILAFSLIEYYTYTPSQWHYTFIFLLPHDPHRIAQDTMYVRVCILLLPAMECNYVRGLARFCRRLAIWWRARSRNALLACLDRQSVTERTNCANAGLYNIRGFRVNGIYIFVCGIYFQQLKWICPHNGQWNLADYEEQAHMMYIHMYLAVELGSHWLWTKVGYSVWDLFDISN